MKTQLKALFYSLFTFFVSYLIGSFIEASFDIKEWSLITRFLVGFMGGFWSIYVLVFFYTEDLG